MLLNLLAKLRLLHLRIVLHLPLVVLFVDGLLRLDVLHLLFKLLLADSLVDQLVLLALVLEVNLLLANHELSVHLVLESVEVLREVKELLRFENLVLLLEQVVVGLVDHDEGLLATSGLRKLGSDLVRKLFLLVLVHGVDLIVELFLIDFNLLCVLRADLLGLYLHLLDGHQCLSACFLRLKVAVLVLSILFPLTLEVSVELCKLLHECCLFVWVHRPFGKPLLDFRLLLDEVLGLLRSVELLIDLVLDCCELFLLLDLKLDCVRLDVVLLSLVQLIFEVAEFLLETLSDLLLLSSDVFVDQICGFTLLGVHFSLLGADIEVDAVNLLFKLVLFFLELLDSGGNLLLLASTKHLLELGLRPLLLVGE